mmetsp:Transcript_17047/g.23530  ORF Transcript_17047/g.23530 Transcript_17047/m.23530 type:complete len:123 (+) Transcript_17047:131-499(+)
MDSRVSLRRIGTSHGVFEFLIDQTDEPAIAEYFLLNNSSKDGPTILEIPHTYVPVCARGRGAAAVVTEAAFEFAKSQNMLVLPSCSYVAGAFLNKTAHFRSLCCTIDQVKIPREEANFPSNI